jgi:pyruvate/2-oxoglutarate dehydrogenase complex dihydrolipoamide dehydrogenase (E3) component
MSTSYDAIVIGSGQAAPSLAVRMAEAGMKTVLVEREHLGGTCVNDGCIPTKTLVASARAAHVARRAADWGVNAGAVSVDMKAVKARKDAVVRESIEGLDKWIGRTKKLSLVWGHARFVGPHAIEVDGAILEAPKIFINVGGRPVLPPWKGIADVPVLDNTSMMAVDFLPEHLLIVGGSYIGLEFAQMYRRFGSRVTVLEHGDRLIAREDREVSAEVQKILEREGVAFHLGVKDAAVSKGAAARACASSSTRPAGRWSSKAATCWPPSAGGRTPTTSASTRPASPSTRAATSRSTTSCAPASPASGPWATRTAGAPSPTPPTTTSRSSPATSSMASGAGSATDSPSTPCSSTRRSAGSA